MALPVLILGESGTGKSASLRNFKAEEIKVINVEGKPLPFKNKFESFSSDNYVKILKSMQETTKPVIVIDDAQYLMANEFMRRATERGYDKFTEIAQNFWNLVNKIKELPKDQIVYLLAHIERDQNGNEKIKTIGKLLDEKITVEGMFTIVLKTNVNDGAYTFLTQNSGHDTVKSPIGMFPNVAIDNDLKYVDDKIRNYYEIGNYKSDAEMAAEDDAAKAEAPVEEKKTRRGRHAEKKEDPQPTEENKEIREEEASDGSGEDSNTEPESNGTDAGTTEEKSTRRRRNLRAEQTSAIVNNIPDDSPEEVPFEEVSQPELPRRKRRGEISDTGTGTITGATPEELREAETEPETTSNDNAEDAAPVRRRRRRA